MAEVVRSRPGQHKGEKKSNSMLSEPKRRKVKKKKKNYGSNFHSVENNQQVPQWSNTLAAMERIVWKDLGSTGKVGDKKSEDMA